MRKKKWADNEKTNYPANGRANYRANYQANGPGYEVGR
jgi:hypothetical protein